MERLTKVWNSLRAMLLRAVRERKRECLTVGAGTAVVIAAVGSLMGSKPMIVKQMGEITVTQEASGQKEEEWLCRGNRWNPGYKRTYKKLSGCWRSL